MSTASVLDSAKTETSVPADDGLYEIVDGELVEKTMSALAIWIASRLNQLLGSFVFDQGLGTVVMEMLFLLDRARNRRRRPDVAFISATTWPPNQPIPEEGDWEVVPDLAVEVVSPNDGMEEVLDKVHEYFDLGVKQVWVIVPSVRQAYIYDSPTQDHIVSADQNLEGGTLIPGWRVPLASLFPQPESMPSPE